MIKGLSIRARELGAVNLGQGIPSFPTPPHILEAAKAALSDPGIGIYPNFLGEAELRDAIAKRLTADHPKTKTVRDSVLVTVGAMEATAASILSVVETGDTVGIISPDYCNHEPQVLLAKGKVQYLPLLETETGWAIDREAARAAFEKGLRMLLYTNPGNPTGFVFSRDDISFLAGLAREHDAWILADETYGFLTYGVPFVSLLDVAGGYEKAITVRSFSKEYAMTGWRVGYLAADPRAVPEIAKAHDALTGCVPKISQRAAIAALNGPQTAVSEFRKIFETRREIAMAGLSGIPGISVIAPLGAYYAFPQYRTDMESPALCETLLTRHGVAVVPGDAFGTGGARHFRISFAVSDDALSEGIARIRAFFAAA